MLIPVIFFATIVSLGTLFGQSVVLGFLLLLVLQYPLKTVPYLLVYKSTSQFQGQKSDFSSFRAKQMKFTPI